MSEQTQRTATALLIAVLDDDEQAAAALFTGDDIDVQYAAQTATDLARWLIHSLAPDVTPGEFRDGLADALRHLPTA
jgi:hypothetical protein